MPEFTKFITWKKELLDRHELDAADGRSLYLYRLTEDDFNELEELLRYWLSQLLPRYGLADVAKASGFAELFVLYAAEWWRRRYDGSGFSWEPILRDLGANPEEWSSAQRSDFVKEGFRRWRIRPREHGGLRFIGSVAVQGGLPLKLLATSRGSIGHLLSRVLYLASGSQVSHSDLSSWVESLSRTLPHSYRQETIYTLLTDVAWTVLDLKQKADLKSSADALDILNQKIPGWKDRFPLPVEDKHAQGMIEQLIRDAAGVRIEKQTALLPIERLLENTNDDEWVLRSYLDLPKSLSIQNLASLFFIDDVNDLPRIAELSLRVGDAEASVDMRKLSGQHKYRLDRKPLGFEGKIATGEHLLRMTSPDGRVWTITAIRGDELDTQLPWVFIKKDSSVYFVRQGSGTVAAQEALIALPKDWEIENDENSAITETGSLRDFERRLVTVRGVFRAHDENGLAFRLRTGQVSADEERYAWDGNRYWLDFLSPSMAFRGMPSLYRVGDDEVKRKVEGQIGINTIGRSTGSRSTSGPLYLRHPASGDVNYRSKVLVLPKSANIDFTPKNAVSGTLKFCDWDIARVRVTTEGVEQSLKLAEGDAILDVSVKEEQRAPDLIELEAYWLHSTVPARLRLPFPAHGIRVFDGQGRSLMDGSLLAVQQLYGVRILISGGQVNRHSEMEILDSTRKLARKYPLRTLSGALSMEIRLQDYLSDIQQLFSIRDQPDERITIHIRSQGRLFKILLARYSAILERDGDNIRLDNEVLKSQEIQDLEQLPALAVRLESPGDEAMTLEPFLSEGVATGGWVFSPHLRSPGSWLIYPAVDSKLPFRHTLWPVDGDVSEEEGLSGAFTISGQQERELSIHEIIEELASDFCNDDWEKVEQLAGQVGHLPLPTLDIWRCFANSPRGMAALALRFGGLKPEFIIRFSQELPFAWETIAFDDWQMAMLQLKAQCESLFGNENDLTVLASHLSSKIQFLTSLNGSLAFLLGIAANEWLPDTRREVESLKLIANQTHQSLFEGADSKLMCLRRQHANDQWPSDLKSQWPFTDTDPRIEPYLYTDAVSFRAQAINLPIIVAVQAMIGQTTNWFLDAEHIHALRNYQSFDPDWFEEVYNWTVARCFADGLLDETTTP
ncbi:MAG: hypothetical protein ISN28_15150 [Ectothiorhodospiraceae bacterium AqS1]|nr:hypothetical protein [Ectothiorhodospiraceae bacterium AqS1]